MRIKLPTHFPNMNRAEAEYVARAINEHYGDDFPGSTAILAVPYMSHTSRGAFDVAMVHSFGDALQAEWNPTEYAEAPVTWAERLNAFAAGVLYAVRIDTAPKAPIPALAK